jgi:hypothetical protein
MVAANTFVVVPGKTESRVPIFSVLLKRTYNINPGHALVRAELTKPFIQVDEYYDDGNPEESTVKYENELTPYKIATDLVCIGKAYTPGGKPAAQIDVSLEVGQHKKIIRVTGDRHCIYRENRVPHFTEPGQFTEMEIRYERSYGGIWMRNDPTRLFPYPRNPMGSGFAIDNVREEVNGLRLPNLEDATDLLTPERVTVGERERWNRQPLPQGFGWFQKTWYPRCSFVGSVPGFVDPDEVMREEVLGLVPKRQIALARQFKLPSFDVRFNNGASLGLALPYLRGDEPIVLTNLTQEGQLRFTLPGDALRIMLDIGLGENELEVVLETVCIRAEDRQVDLIWRGAHQYPGVEWLPEMKRMVARVS